MKSTVNNLDKDVIMQAAEIFMAYLNSYILF